MRLISLTREAFSTAVSPFTDFDIVHRYHENTNETMSHFTTIKTQIKDIEALSSARQEVGLSLLQNAEARGYYESKIKGDYVIQLNGPRSWLLCCVTDNAELSW
jgi:hypothetical protein